MGKFWESVGEKLADRWVAVSVPALVFWLGGLLAWVYGRGGFHALKAPADWLAKQPGPTQIAILVAALLGVAASGVAVARLTTPVLRLMEGYWPRFFDGARRPLVKHACRQAESIESQFQAVAGPVLTGTPPPTPSSELITPSLPSAGDGSLGRDAISRHVWATRCVREKVGQLTSTAWTRLPLAALVAAVARDSPHGTRSRAPVPRCGGRRLHLGGAVRSFHTVDAMGSGRRSRCRQRGASVLGSRPGRGLCRPR